MKSRILFLIPVYRHSVKTILKEICKNFPTSYVLIVSDGSSVDTLGYKNVNILAHKTNMGLATTLVDGYKESLKFDIDFVVRIDADLEYPLNPVKETIIRLQKDANSVGAFIEVKRSIFSNGTLDFVFHKVFGFIEGYVLFGLPMCQHSPGLQIYKKNIVERFIDNLEKFKDEKKLKWGLDLVSLKLARIYGNLVPIMVSNPNWVERRSAKKILSQSISALKILTAILFASREYYLGNYDYTKAVLAEENLYE